MRNLLASLVMLFLIVCMASPAHGRVLMDPAEVENVLGDPEWIILDCRIKKLYDAEHIPGAIHLGDGCRSALRDGTERVLPPSELEKVLGNAGISNDTHLVIYADAKTLVFATVGFWILEYLGHDKVHLLDGGIDSWKAAGKQVVREQTKRAPAVFRARPNPAMIASTSYMVEIAKGNAGDVQMIDCRSEKEFQGRDIRALRGGHLPRTTANIPHDMVFDRKKGTFLALTEIEKYFRLLDRNKTTVLVCQSGSRSTVTYFQMKRLGFTRLLNYDDGFTVYANSLYPPYPLEDEQWINLEVISRLRTDVEQMQNEVARLRKEMDELRKAK